MAQASRIEASFPKSTLDTKADTRQSLTGLVYPPDRRLEMKRVLIFPGQGSQQIGMGKAVFDAFPEARLVYEEVNDALNQNLS